MKQVVIELRLIVDGKLAQCDATELNEEQAASPKCIEAALHFLNTGALPDFVTKLVTANNP